MRPEAYTVSYDRANYHAPLSVGLNGASVLQAREQGIKEGMLRYLGEYRLGGKFDEFFYQVEKDPLTGEQYLTKGEPGPVRNKFRRAIKAREEQGLSVRREVAECLGFEKLEQAAINASDNTLFAWVSPPGPKEDGYGNYSFTFVGQIRQDHGVKRIRVIPYRNILSKEKHRAYLSRLSPRAKSFVSDVDFLANPIIFSPRPGLGTPEEVLKFIGEQEELNTDWFDRLGEAIGPLVQGYIALVKKGASDEELMRARWALENYTIAIKTSLISDVVNEGSVSRADLSQTATIFQRWGNNAPQPVGGSCGASDKDNSTLMDYHNSEIKGVVGTLDCVKCPFCEKTVNALLTEDKIICPECKQSADRK